MWHNYKGNGWRKLSRVLWAQCLGVISCWPLIGSQSRSIMPRDFLMFLLSKNHILKCLHLLVKQRLHRVSYKMLFKIKKKYWRTHLIALESLMQLGFHKIFSHQSFSPLLFKCVWFSWVSHHPDYLEIMLTLLLLEHVKGKMTAELWSAPVAPCIHQSQVDFPKFGFVETA